MRVAVFGQRTDGISQYIPDDADEMVLGEDGAGAAAQEWADLNGMPKIVIRQGKSISREKCAELIIEIADMAVAIWDGRCEITRRYILLAQKKGKPMKVIRLLSNNVRAAIEIHSQK